MATIRRIIIIIISYRYCETHMQENNNIIYIISNAKTIYRTILIITSALIGQKSHYYIVSNLLYRYILYCISFGVRWCYY